MAFEPSFLGVTSDEQRLFLVTIYLSLVIALKTLGIFDIFGISYV